MPLCHCATAALRQDTSTHPSQQRSGTVAQWHKLHCDFSCKFLKKKRGESIVSYLFFSYLCIVKLERFRRAASTMQRPRLEGAKLNAGHDSAWKEQSLMRGMILLQLYDDNVWVLPFRPVEIQLLDVAG